ncbi:MAG: sulfatase [Phycisphaeraceae bacterium]|nr:sulfatase [Phycisphaeraceae bacterium]
MRAVILMFDSLNRHMLSPYGCTWTHTPNFQRLAQRSTTFERAYCCSMPCMPARREMHTGRPNFLECGWSALQPYDDSMPEMLTRQGIHTHLATDHYHYWEEPASNYHCRFQTWEFFRGQEGDVWRGHAGPVDIPPNQNKKGRPQDWINRTFIRNEEDWPGAQTVRAGIDHIRRNAPYDRWLLQLECFDPHEPYFVPEKYRDLFETLRNFDGPLFDWPGYCPVDESPELIEVARCNYAALLAMCDAHLGDVLDVFDELDLWRDTMLVVNTDHGFLLGEHEWWAKNTPPWYEELSHIPLFIHDPRHPAADGQRCSSLVQTIDLAPTILDFFGMEPTPRMIGVPLGPMIAGDHAGRGAGIFGGFGHMVNVTDGRHVYMRAPADPEGGPLNEYMLNTISLNKRLSSSAPPPYELVPGFEFTGGMPVLRIPAPEGRGKHAHRFGNLLFDLESDPQQQAPLSDPKIEKRMIDLLVREMRRVDAPREQYQRLDLTDPA